MAVSKGSTNQAWSKFGHYLSLCLIFLGVVVRSIQYLSNRSFWGDEVNLALNIIERSYEELFQVLDNNQAAPLGFLWWSKLNTQIWGNSEYVLRLLPFIASIVSLGLFYRLVRQYCSGLAAPIAIALFVGGRHTLYFATELKPYSSDVAIALILFWLLVKASPQILPTKQIISYSCIGSLAIWLSYPSIFILAGIEGCSLLFVNRKNFFEIISNRLVIYVCWIISFGLFYWLAIVNTLSNEDLNSSWSSRYPDSWVDITWLFDALGRFFYHPMGFRGITDGIGIFAFIVGCIVYYRRDRTIFLYLVAPFIATIIAAYLHKYPFRDRLILFLAPFGIMIVAEGIAFMLSKLSYHYRGNFFQLPGLLSLLGIVCLWALVFPPLGRVARLTINPETKHEVKPVLEYVARNSQPEDRIYVYAEANQAVIYYAALNDYTDLDYTYGTTSFSAKGKKLSDKLDELAQDLQPLQGHQVWFILRADSAAEMEFLEYLDRVGTRKDYFRQPGASAYLYDLPNWKQ